MSWPPSQRTRGCAEVPVDGEGFVDLHVLAGFDAAAAEDALLRVVAIEGVGAVLLVGLGRVGGGLVFYVEVCGGVVDGAVLVVVIADGAVEEMVAEDAIEGFALGGVDCFGLRVDGEAGSDFASTGAGELAVDLDHAGVAGADGAELRVITDLRDFEAGVVEGVDEG